MKQKILINLLSEQKIPNLIPILQIKPDKVIALATDEFAWQVKIFEELSKVPHELLPFSAYDFQGDITSFRKLLGELESENEVFINFTGGTKIMAMSAVISGITKRTENIALIYVDTVNRRITNLRMKGSGLQMDSQPINAVIPFPYYIALSRDSITSSIENQTPEEIERLALTNELAQDRKLNGLFDTRIQRALCAASQENTPFSIPFSTNKVPAGKAESDESSFNFTIPGGKSFSFRHSDGARYLSGQWLEEYVFERLLKSKSFDSISRNVIISLRSDSIKALSEKRRRSPFTDKNELDIVAIAGKRAVIIECKSGNVLQDHVYKLASLRDYLLGSFGVAVLACKFEPGAHIIEKCSDLGILVVSGGALPSIADDIKRKLD